MITHLEKNRKLSLIMTIIIATGIFLVSTIESSNIPSSGFDFSYIYHFGIFFLFGLFLLITIKGEKETEKHHIFLVLLISIAYAALDEFHQSFVPGRTSSLIDFAIDTLGIIFSVIFYEIFNKKVRTKN